MFFRSIKAIISNSFKLRLRNMSDKSSNKLENMNFFNNKIIIFMSLIPKRDKIITIDIYYTILCEARSTTIS